MLPTLQRYATELRTSHHAWQDRLWQARPKSDATQIASKALEIALQELEHLLPSAFPPNDNEAIPIEAAMAFVNHHTPPA